MQNTHTKYTHKIHNTFILTWKECRPWFSQYDLFETSVMTREKSPSAWWKLALRPAFFRNAVLALKMEYPLHDGLVGSRSWNNFSWHNRCNGGFSNSFTCRVIALRGPSNPPTKNQKSWWCHGPTTPNHTERSIRKKKVRTKQTRRSFEYRSNIDIYIFWSIHTYINIHSNVANSEDIDQYIIYLVIYIYINIYMYIYTSI